MAREVSILESIGGWAGLSGWVAAVVTPSLMWLAARRKTDVDESAVILGKWKELVEAHETSIKRLTEDFERDRQRSIDEIKSLREEASGLRVRIRDLEAAGREKDGQIDALKAEVRGLRDSIIQNSRSSAQLIGKSSGIQEPPMTEEVTRLDQAGHNRP